MACESFGLIAMPRIAASEKSLTLLRPRHQQAAFDGRNTD
jgi:hypothetical protein